MKSGLGSNRLLSKRLNGGSKEPRQNMARDEDCPGVADLQKQQKNALL